MNVRLWRLHKLYGKHEFKTLADEGGCYVAACHCGQIASAFMCRELQPELCPGAGWEAVAEGRNTNPAYLKPAVIAAAKDYIQLRRWVNAKEPYEC